MHLRKTFVLLLGAALLVGFSVMGVAAATNADNVMVNNPVSAGYIDSAPHTLAAHSEQWFKFDYSADKNDDGSRNPVTVTIAKLTMPDIRFDVYTPDQAASWWESDTHPIGQSARHDITCGKIDDDWTYTCQTYDLTWTGKFTSNGTYYVCVENNSDMPVTFTLTKQP